MSDAGASRFAPQSKSTQQRISTNTVGLVNLSDFRKRRAEVLEQQERESREAAFTGTSSTPAASDGTPDHGGSDSARSSVGPPDADGQAPAKKKLKKKAGKKLLSFGDDEDEDDAKGTESTNPKNKKEVDESSETDGEVKSKFKANASVNFVPKSKTKAALRKEATEREALRKEFLAVQEAVKATEIAIPFIFYDGSNIPGGVVRVKKGDFTWVFLDKSRKVGAEMGVGNNAQKSWARVGVDDLMLVRGTVIIPHVSYV
jgi:protein FAM50